VASKEFIEIIPFGGGTTVLGGITPTKNPSLSVDMMHFKTIDLDEISHTANLGAGLRGPEIEEKLEKNGFTLGHFPQSFEFSTLGGWVATRSAGQASTKYGKIEDMVLGLRMVTPKGIIRVLPHPASSTGPGLKNLYIGSEGIFGIITSATLQVKSIPRVREYKGFFFKTFHEGIRAIRTFMQNGIAPAVVRLSDVEETAVSLALSQKKGITKEGLGSWVLQKSGFRCLLILGMEGSREEVAYESEVSRYVIKEFHGLGVGKSAGEAWKKERFRHPYLRDALLERGVMIDTLETVTSWNNLEELHRKTKEAIEKTIGKRGIRSIVMAHISHVYETGACLYFTFMAPQAKDKISQWEDVKSVATRTILESGGALSHHHGIGIDHALFFIAEHGKEGVEAVRRTKMLFDPSGILNPGKVLVKTRARKTKGN
jgi:alkyldihydroxyacetonephosphate synthase